MKDGKDPAPLERLRRCPICTKAAAERFRPFCSKRCADLDLHRWLNGQYAVAAEEDEERPDLDEPGDGPEGGTGAQP